MEGKRTIREAWHRASSFLRECGAGSPDFEAELMLRRLLGVDRARFFAEWNGQWPDCLDTWLSDWLKRRRDGEPLQYLLGDQEFFGRSFIVTPAVLIPRPETEILVEAVIREARAVFGGQPLHVVDVGTGSGAIAVTLALELPAARITAIDISEEALDVARENAVRHGVDGRIRWVCGEYLAPLLEEQDSADVLVSNPPYIPTEEISRLQKEVRDYEPRLALDGGSDGLDPYREMARQLRQWCGGPRRVFFEIGDGQGQDVRRILHDAFPGSEVRILPDLAGRDRVVAARLTGWV
jgi:release factor glutamine methyltransferase